MESPTPKKLARLIERYLDPQKKWNAKLDAQMRDALRDSESGRATYRERVAAHRLMVSGDANEASGFESERMLDALLDGATPVASKDQRFWIRLGSIVAGAAAIFAVVIQSPSGLDSSNSTPQSNLADGAPQGEYLGSRGVDRKEQPAGLGISGVPVAGGLTYEIVASQGVSQKDSMRLHYRNTNPELTHLFVFAMQDRGDVRWYVPLPSEGKSARIKVGKEALFDIELSDSHRPGALRVFAIFSRQPLAFDKVKQTVEHDLGFMASSLSTVKGKLTMDLGLDAQTEIVTVLDTVILDGSGIQAGE
jgi:hypothetical protein